MNKNIGLETLEGVYTHTGSFKKNKINKESLKSLGGITLIALVITIIILLILAGVSIQAITNTGLFNRTKQAKNITRYSNAKEIINTKLMEIETNCYSNNIEYNIKEIAKDIKEDNNITIEKYYNNEISGIKEGITENIVNLNGIVVSVNDYAEYKFLIGKQCSIDKVKTGDINDLTNINDFVDIKNFENKNFGVNVDSNNNNDGQKFEKYVEYKFGNIEKSNVKLYNGKIQEKGIEFDGTSTYGTLELGDLTFPMSIEMSVQSTQNDGAVLYIDSKTKTAISVGTYFTCTVNNNAETYKVPEDFFDGNIKNIVVTYNSLTDFNVFVNGTELEKYGKKSSLTSYIPSTARIGSRSGTDYFKGTIYKFRIYDKILSESEILSSYISDKNYIENDSEEIVRNNVVYTMNISEIKDLSGNQKNIIINDGESNEEKNGCIFNGTSTFAEVDLENIIFPMTVEMTIQSTQKNGTVLYIDPKSKTAISIGSYFTCTVNDEAETYKTPEDFFDGTLKNIIITYNSLTDFNVFVNGVKLEKYGSKSSLTVNIPPVAYIGSRSGKDYFDGTVYDFTIYKGILEEKCIINKYNEKLKLYH